MRRGIDNYFSVSADIVVFVNKAENTSQESEESDKMLVKAKKKKAGGRSGQFRQSAFSGMTHHAPKALVTHFILPLPPLPRCVTARSGYTGMDGPDHDQIRRSAAPQNLLRPPLARLLQVAPSQGSQERKGTGRAAEVVEVPAAPFLLPSARPAEVAIFVKKYQQACPESLHCWAPAANGALLIRWTVSQFL